MSQSAFIPKGRNRQTVKNTEDRKNNLNVNEDLETKERDSPSALNLPDSLMSKLYTRKDSSSSSGTGSSIGGMAQSGGTTSQGGKLAQEIHDEFLVCKICLEAYKNPKSLNCLHTFCEQCIDNHVMSESTYKKYSDYRDFTCPLCRKRTQLPIGGVKKLPDNFLVANLSEVIVRQRPSKFPFCDICKMINRKHKEAESKCLDCNKLLCRSCVEMHRETKVTKNHSIFDCEIEKDVECKEHPEEVVRFYCEPCETCICVLCTFNEHKDHEISQFGEAVKMYKETIQELVDNCRTKINKFDGQLENLDKCEAIIKEAEQKIHDTAIQYIADVRNKEKQMIEEIQNLYGPTTMEYVAKKAEMSTNIEGLRATCNLTEVILRGKDIELLLLKKDVQAKLSALSAVEINSLPQTVEKEVNFIPGVLDFGYIQDKDRPLLSKMRAIRSFRQSLETSVEEELESSKKEVKKEIRHRAIQTDPPPKPAESESESESEEEEDEKPTMVDKGTVTDKVSVEEKGVNTRSRSLQSMQQLSRSSPPKDSADPPANQTTNDTTMDYINARRHRRRHRERPKTMDMSSYADNIDTSTGDSSYMPPRTMSQDDGTRSIADRRRYRSSRMPYGSSLDHYNDDDFYSAENSPTTTSPL